MGDQQGARAGGAQDLGHLLAQRQAQAGVQGGEGLVEQDHLWLRRQRAGQRDPLSLAARELVRKILCAVSEAHQIEAVLHAAGPRATEADVAGDGEVREERAVLEDHADAPPVGLLPGVVAGHPAPADLHGPGVGRLEARDDAQEGGLARAAGPQQRDELSAVHP